jgi:hypothetical protein
MAWRSPRQLGCLWRWDFLLTVAGDRGSWSPISPKANIPNMTPDWLRPSDYEELLAIDRRAFAWEWLRRSKDYRAAWQNWMSGEGSDRLQARRFGLERFEDPCRPSPAARPIWSVEADPGVLPVRLSNLFAAEGDRVDLLRLASFVTLDVADDDTERLLLSDGRHFVRLDVVEGTLIGCPGSLAYLIEGGAGLREPLTTIHQLIGLMSHHRFAQPKPPRSRRRQRWILELRVADALAAGASQQEIARVLFGDAISATRWRIEAPAYRQRVQRLVASAREHLRQPLHRRWFQSDGSA